MGRKANSNVHLADEAILVHSLARATLGLLGPHLLHVLEDHVAVSVKGLDAGQELAIVSAGDQHLGVVAAGGRQEGERTGGELVLLDKSDLIFPDAFHYARSVSMLQVGFGGMQGMSKWTRKMQVFQPAGQKLERKGADDIRGPSA